MKTYISLLTLFAGWLVIVSCGSKKAETEEKESPKITYEEPFRPQFHFSPPQNWINDPNGLTYHNGEYHLFYQYNPYGDVWGHMSWGHAVSNDLVHWEHLPVALKEENNVMIFSGSAVSDVNNTSGFGTKENPPMVAIYTGHHTDKELQEQHIAYSVDDGRTWTKYKGNPVLNINKANFRDPKVIWHEPTQKWVMVVALSEDRKVHFYGSENLKDWEFLSEFGPAAATKGVWECPDLFELPVEGTDGETRWVLQIDMNPGAIAGGSGGQYFVGRFDGKTFSAEMPEESEKAEPLWVDYGKDFYAVQSWSNVKDRRIWLAWMNNWQYARDIPTHPWRGSMTIPRTVSLKAYPEGRRLVQRPVEELKMLRKEAVNVNNLAVSNRSINLADRGIEGKKIEIIASFRVEDATEFGFKVRKGDDQETLVGYSVQKQQLFIDRSRSGRVNFHKEFPGRHTAPLTPEDGVVRMHIFIDHSSVEVFGNGGKVVITDRIFPDESSDQVELFATQGSTELLSLRAWNLNSVW